MGGRDLPEFCGWKTLIDLMREAENTIYYENSHLFTSDQNPDLTVRDLRAALLTRDKGLISSAFSTGGRISEVLMLKRKSFLIFDKYVAVVNMPVISGGKRLVKLPKPGISMTSLPGRIGTSATWSLRRDCG